MSHAQSLARRPVPTHSSSWRGRKLDLGYERRVIGAQSAAMDGRAARRHLNNTALGSIKTNESHSGHCWRPVAAGGRGSRCDRPAAAMGGRPAARRGAPHRQMPAHSSRTDPTTPLLRRYTDRPATHSNTWQHTAVTATHR